MLSSTIVSNQVAIPITVPTKGKKNKLSDFNNLMMLLEDGIIDEQGNPNEALIALTNYFHLLDEKDYSFKSKNKNNLEDLTISWDKKFFLRRAQTGRPIERWDLQRLTIGHEWELHRHEILPLLKNTGLLSARFPRYGEYDTLIIHGAWQEDIWPRFQFLAKFWQQGGRFKRIVFLTGERQLESYELDHNNYLGISFEEVLSKNISAEIDFMKYAWQIGNIIPREILQIPTFWIDTPNFIDSNGIERRGVTEDTIDVWLDGKSLKEKIDWGHCLAISNAPLTLRQHLVFERGIHKRNLDILIETAGPAEEKEGGQWIIYYLREIAALLWELRQLQHDINSPLHV